MAQDAREVAGGARPFTLNVDPLPPPPPEPKISSVAGEPKISSVAGEPVLGADWTREDFSNLIAWLRAPYDKIALTTGEAWIVPDDAELVKMAVPMTMWMPAGWLRGKSERMPWFVAAPVTVAMIAWVNGPLLMRWNREHPDQAIDVVTPAAFLVRRLFGAIAKPEVQRDDRPNASTERPQRGGDVDRRSGAAESADAPGPPGRRHLSVDPNDL